MVINLGFLSHLVVFLWFCFIHVYYFILYYKTYFLHLWKHFILYSATGDINWPVSLSISYRFTVSVTPLPMSYNKIMHYLCVFMSQAVQALFVYSVYWNVDMMMMMMMMMESYTMVMILTDDRTESEREESGTEWEYLLFSKAQVKHNWVWLPHVQMT